MEFTLRPLRMEDAVSIARYANNSAIAGNLTNQFPHPYKLEDANRWLSMVTNPEHPSLILGIEIAGEVSGGIGLHPQADVWSRNAELGYWLAEPYWGKGIMTQAVREMVQTGFHRLAIDRIFARPFGSNVGSQRVLEKAGFVLEAKLKQTIYKQGRYEDELIYAVRR